jgi:elongation factor G
MLFNTGAINRLDRVEDGTTTSDYEAAEIKRHSSIQTSVVSCIWNNIKVNLLDTPGYADFIGEINSAILVADAALVLVTAQSGVNVGARRM